MANVLTADDATFAATVGNWTNDVAVPTAVTRQTTPTSPAGNNVGREQRTGTPPGNGFVFAQIPRAIYPVNPGNLISMQVAFSAPATNAGTGTLFCQIQIVFYPAAAGTGGTVSGSATSPTFTKGDGWHQLAIAQFTVPTLIGGDTPVWAGCSVRFGPNTGTGIVVDDVAYFSDVVLDIPTVAGWGVGLVRMGAN